MKKVIFAIFVSSMSLIALEPSISKRNKIITALENNIASANKIYKLTVCSQKEIEENFSIEIMPLLINDAMLEYKEDCNFFMNQEFNDELKQKTIQHFYEQTSIEKLIQEKKEFLLALIQAMKHDPVLAQCFKSRCDNYQKCLDFMKRSDKDDRKALLYYSQWQVKMAQDASEKLLEARLYEMTKDVTRNAHL
jgi:hypothetical protein